ncbi:hypothetical protein ALON55S_06016 [Alishewanella longhuensis]
MAKFRLYLEENNRSPLAHLWREFARQHSALFGLVLFSSFLLLSLLAPLLTPHDLIYRMIACCYCPLPGQNKVWCNILLAQTILAGIYCHVC